MQNAGHLYYYVYSEKLQCAIDNRNYEQNLNKKKSANHLNVSEKCTKLSSIWNGDFKNKTHRILLSNGYKIAIARKVNKLAMKTIDIRFVFILMK